MGWTFDEIERDWLAGSRLAFSSEAIVAGFNLAEKMLGRQWVEASRISSGSVVRGSAPTLRVANMGRRLAAIGDAPYGADSLVERIRRGHQSAEAELTALYLLRSRRSGTTVDLYPAVGEREADFRICGDDGPWTYVEVTQPNISEAENEARKVLEGLAALLLAVKKPFALEVFLRKEPTEHELALLRGRVPEFCKQEGVHREELANELGMLLLNNSAPGQVILQDHPGEEKRPRISMAKAIVGPDEPHRHVAVRMAFADERADAFLTKEARQLPKDAPGLIMVQMSHVSGGFKSWEPILRRRFQPALHTRVCAVCLFSSGLLPTPEGEAWLPQTKLIDNPYSRLALPSWIADALKEAGAEFARHLGL